MASEFFKRKMKTFIKRFDINGDGVLTRDDFIIMADRFTENEPSKRQKTREDFTKFFDVVYAIGGEDDKMTDESVTKAVVKMRTDLKSQKVLDDAIVATFHLLDASGDGYIQEKEYITFLDQLRFRDHENMAKFAFKGLDTNQDGELSEEEFRNAFLDFFLSEDETRPGTLIYGPLIEE